MFILEVLSNSLFRLRGYGLKDLAASVLEVRLDKDDGIRQSNWEQELSNTQVGFL